MCVPVDFDARGLPLGGPPPDREIRVKRFLLPIAFLALLGFQVLPSATLAWQQSQRLQHGRPVHLAVETRDPRDLFRGEYSVLNYEVGRLQAVGAASIPAGCDLTARETCQLASGTPVYLRLVPDAEGVHRASEVLFEPPSGDTLFIAGRLSFATLARQGTAIKSVSGARASGATDAVVCLVSACLTGRVSYGIENWFGPQGVPGKLDRAARKDVVVEVRLGADGIAAIDGIQVGGQYFARTARLW